MKPRLNSFLRFTVAAALACVGSGYADTLTWNNGASTANWNTSDANWTGDTWDNLVPDSAIFGATGVGTVTLTTGISVDDITFDTAGYTVTGNTLTVLGGQASIITANANAAISSNIAGGDLVKNGSATLTLSGTNTYGGGTVINNGTLEITSMSNISSNWFAMDNTSTLRYIGTGAESTSRDIWINNNDGTRTFDIVNASATLTLASGGGSITRDIQKSGAGTLALGRVTSGGNTLVSNGVLEVTSTGKLYGGGYTASPTITVASGGTLRLNGWSWDAAGSIANLDYSRERLVVNGGTIEYTGASNLNPADTGSSSRNLTIGTGGATLKASSPSGQTWTINSANGNLINGNGLTLDGAGAGEIQKVIEGSGSLTKIGSGIWTLSGANNYAGDTIVNEGSLQLSSTSQMLFLVNELPTSNQITGTGSATFDGVFNINTAAVSGATGYIWLLVDRASLSNESFGPNFGVDGFTQQGDGVTWTMANAKGNWSFSETTGELTLSVSDYNGWGAAYGLGSGSEGDDLDNDGLTNREEYAFGLLPNNGSSANAIIVPLEKTNGTFSYTRRLLSLTDLSYTVWYSTDLATWNQDTGAVEGTPSVNDEVETVPVTISPALLGNTKLFIQVRAE